MSILKPLNGAESELSRNLESFFIQRTEIPFELLFSLETQRDEAYVVVTDLIKKYPRMKAQIFLLENTAQAFAEGKNPKLKNVNKSFEHAHFDTIWIGDSNVRLKQGELEALVNELDESTGIVTAIVSGIEFSGLGGALESVFLGTFYARFMALRNRYAKPCEVVLEQRRSLGTDPQIARSARLLCRALFWNFANEFCGCSWIELSLPLSIFLRLSVFLGNVVQLGFSLLCKHDRLRILLWACIPVILDAA